ncbi:3'-5' exonuclease family protein [Pseudomonas mohnii]
MSSRKGRKVMKLFLDCEFTQLNQNSKLISLALVSEASDEFYVELTDTYQVEDCSDFVIQHVLPQLSLTRYGMSLVDAQAALRVFLSSIGDQLEVCSDAPEWDWEFFCQLAYVDHKWPSHVENRPTNLIHLFRHFEADDIGNITLPDLPHHALLDARLLAGLYQRLAGASKQVGD